MPIIQENTDDLMFFEHMNTEDLHHSRINLYNDTATVNAMASVEPDKYIVVKTQPTGYSIGSVTTIDENLMLMLERLIK